MCAYVVIFSVLILITELQGQAFMDNLKVTGVKNSFEDAIAYCQAIEMRLVQVEMEVTMNLLKELKIPMWIDMKYDKKSGKYAHNDGSEIKRYYWAIGQPGDERCAFIEPGNEGMKTECCCKKLNVVCYKPLVFIMKNVTYQEAFSYCNNNGMQLFKDTDEKRSRAVFDLGKFYGQYWLDANDIKKNGTWTDFAGDVLTYLPWAPREPVRERDRHCVVGNAYSTYKWAAEVCSTPHGFICTVVI